MVGRSVRRGALVVAAAVALAGCAATVPDDSGPASSAATAPSSAATALDGALVLDPSHDYGDRYADGILPVGDEHWSLSDPAVGTVYLCRDMFVPDERAGAQTRGPWFVNGDTEYDLNLKVHVEGQVDEAICRSGSHIEIVLEQLQANGFRITELQRGLVMGRFGNPRLAECFLQPSIVLAHCSSFCHACGSSTPRRPGMERNQDRIAL